MGWMAKGCNVHEELPRAREETTILTRAMKIPCCSDALDNRWPVGAGVINLPLKTEF